jgi:hypothetical protein
MRYYRRSACNDNNLSFPIQKPSWRTMFPQSLISLSLMHVDWAFILCDSVERSLAGEGDDNFTREAQRRTTSWVFSFRL